MAEKTGRWLKVFCPEARCLTDEEVAALPEEQRRATADKEGLWLDLFCPDESCLKEGDYGFVARPGQDKSGQAGMWLELFCPDSSCLHEEGTDLA
jgi:hypothetical protein